MGNLKQCISKVVEGTKREKEMGESGKKDSLKAVPIVNGGLWKTK